MRKLRFQTTAVLAVLVPLLLVACGDRDAGLSRAEVEEIVREEMAEAPATPQSERGLTRAEVERIVQDAIADIPDPQPGLTSSEAERIARGVIASIPPKSAPAEYTRFFVDNAVSLYETQGLDATLAYYNRPESIDGQWYLFIIDENGLAIAHPDPGRLGLDLNGWVGTDANGYDFGSEILSAGEDGKWVSYVYQNPESGGFGVDFDHLELKNVWVVRHEELLFASGWYINAEEFTKSLVATAVDQFRSGGLAATVAYFASPGSALAGLETTIDYYNSADTVEGEWVAFIADRDGKVVAHSDLAMIGKQLQDLYLFDEETARAPHDGTWVTGEGTNASTGLQQSMRIWVVGYDGMTFGSGWYNDGSGG